MQHGPAVSTRLLTLIVALLQVDRLITGGRSDLTLTDLQASFKFPLDSFQSNAVQALLDGESVVCCAPTGAGKTAIAEAAAVAVLARWAFLNQGHILPERLQLFALLHAVTYATTWQQSNSLLLQWSHVSR